MPEAKIPEDESTRLETLRSLNILDTAPEERFDRLTRVAKRTFEVPIAVVSLVDENRQWFKSALGIDMIETPRAMAFCSHAILGKGVLIIPDAQQDPRFSDNPLVLGEAHIRFYAGCPIVLDGQPMGTLCIIDQKPRQLAQDDIEALKDLAAIVEQTLAAYQLSTIDELTKIPNRRGFLSLAQHSLNLCARQNIPVSLVFVDLDKFKSINDTFGHAEGDNALITFSTKIQNRSRKSDIFARLGGDEFVFLLPNTSKEIAEKVMQDYRNLLAKHNKKEKNGYDIGFSCGIVEYIQGTPPSIEIMLAQGDSLMYEVKRAKRAK